MHVRYACKLPYKAARLCVLASLMDGSEDGSGPDAGVLGRARREAHQLKGTAGAYGFEAVSRVAGLVEDELAAGCDRSALAHLVDRLLAAAKAECERSLALTGNAPGHAGGMGT